MTTSPALAPLIGITGRQRSGKDTFAAVLVREFGCQRVAFADPLREALLIENPIVGRPSLPGRLSPTTDVRLHDVISALGWERAKEAVPEVRRLMRTQGDAIRHLDADFWVRIGLYLANDFRAGATYRAAAPVVMTDVRFPNEAEAVRAAGGVLVRVVRPGLEHDDSHASEFAMDGWKVDREILNDGSLSDLEEVARYFARSNL